MGREPKVVKLRVSMPFGPSEHATVVRDALATSYASSYETIVARTRERRRESAKGMAAVESFIVSGG